jgi:hypothetical protein
LICLKERKAKQLLNRCHGQCFILFNRQGTEAMAGLRCDDDARTTADNHVTERLQPVLGVERREGRRLFHPAFLNEVNRNNRFDAI